MKRKRRRKYNPYTLPPGLRKVRFYCRTVIIPIVVFQGVRVFFIPTTGDILLLLILLVIAWLLLADLI